GMNTLNGIVCPATFHSQAGMMRSAPSSNPMEKSGWAREVMPEGLYGPNSQMGFICANVDISASTAKMKRKNALVLAAKYGYAGAPTTFLSVRPLLGIWVCF